MNNSGCIESPKRAIITIEERKRRAIFINTENEKIKKVRIDNCLVKEGKRADWMVVRNCGDAVIVELKGADVEHGCEHLFAMIQNNAILSLSKGRKVLLLVCSRVPNCGSLLDKKKADARRRGVRLKVVSNRFEGSLAELFS